MDKKEFRLRCRICGKTFESYEEHAAHVVSEHPDQLWARFKPEIIGGE